MNEEIRDEIVKELYDRGESASKLLGSKLKKALLKEISEEKNKQKKIKAQAKMEARREIAELGASIPINDRWNVYCDSIETWKAPRQYDYIITDPPYPEEYLPLYETLAEKAVLWLKPGGSLIVMTSQMFMPEIMACMTKHIRYHWLFTYLSPGGQSPWAPHTARTVNSFWKPLLWFVNGDYTGKFVGDVYKSNVNDNEKDFHKWGQSVSGMYDIISKVCSPGQYILDPFCGAGTTGVASLKHGCLFDGLDLDVESINITKGRLYKLDEDIENIKY